MTTAPFICLGVIALVAVAEFTYWRLRRKLVRRCAVRGFWANETRQLREAYVAELRTRKGPRALA